MMTEKLNEESASRLHRAVSHRFEQIEECLETLEKAIDRFGIPASSHPHLMKVTALLRQAADYQARGSHIDRASEGLHAFVKPHMPSAWSE
ncbi:MAG: hypothetical protein AB7I79_03210 [Rhizobiaceae bacterium]